MFESEWEPAWASVDGLMPPPADPAPDWDRPDYEQFVDSLAADDDGSSTRTVAQLVRAATADCVDASLAAALVSIDPRDLDDDTILAMTEAAHRLEAQSAAIKARAAAAFAGLAPNDDQCEAAFAWCEISALLKLGEGTARTYTAEVRHLVANLPGTLSMALEHGLAWSKVRAIVHGTFGLTREQCQAVEARVLPKAADRSPSAHADMVNRWVAKIAPEVCKTRREHARHRADPVASR